MFMHGRRTFAYAFAVSQCRARYQRLMLAPAHVASYSKYNARPPQQQYSRYKESPKANFGPLGKLVMFVSELVTEIVFGMTHVPRYLNTTTKPQSAILKAPILCFTAT
jgi:hypothetical protein